MLGYAASNSLFFVIENCARVAVFIVRRRGAAVYSVRGQRKGLTKIYMGGKQGDGGVRPVLLQ